MCKNVWEPPNRSEEHNFNPTWCEIQLGAELDFFSDTLSAALAQKIHKTHARDATQHNTHAARAAANLLRDGVCCERWEHIGPSEHHQQPQRHPPTRPELHRLVRVTWSGSYAYPSTARVRFSRHPRQNKPPAAAHWVKNSPFAAPVCSLAARRARYLFSALLAAGDYFYCRCPK
jgi:hypothetical protein